MIPLPSWKETVRFSSRILFGLLGLFCVTDVYCQPAAPALPRYDVTAQRIDLLPPGTVIPDNAPPQGWTYLVIKTHPYAATGDLEQLSASSRKLSGLLVTAMVARVQGETVNGRTPYRLSGIATGLGTRIGNQDVVITPDTQKKLGADLGLIARTVLSKSYEKQLENRLVARSDTMIVVDTPAIMVRRNRNRPVTFRYVLLVDPQTGKLNTLVWYIDRDDKGGHTGVGDHMEWLPPNKLQEIPLYVDGREFTLGIPSDQAFATTRLPQGQKQIPMPKDLAPLAGEPQFSTEKAQALETRLRELLKQAGANR